MTRPLERTPLVPKLRGATLADIAAWARDGEKFQINEFIKLHEFLNADKQLNKYLTSGRPVLSADERGTLIYVTDAAAGSKFQGWDGAAWVSLG